MHANPCRPGSIDDVVTVRQLVYDRFCKERFSSLISGFVTETIQANISSLKFVSDIREILLQCIKTLAYDRDRGSISCD